MDGFSTAGANTNAIDATSSAATTTNDGPAGTGDQAAGDNKFTFDPKYLLPEAVFCISRDGWILWANAAAEELLGVPTAKLIGESYGAAFPAEDRGRLARWFLRRERRGERDLYRQARMSAAGGARWVGLRVRQVTVTKDRYVYVCVVHDLHEIHGEIETLRQRTREMQARIDEARAAAQSKTDVLATMSHLLRTPMNGVLGMSRLLLDSELQPDQQMLAEIIQNSGENLLSLIDDILDFSRIEAGSLDLATLDFDLRIATEGVAAGLAPRANEQGIDISYNVSPRVPSLLVGDPGRLRQVLLVLGECAIRFTGQGTVRLQVDLSEETAGQATVRFSAIAPHANGGQDGEVDVFESFVREGVQPSGRHGSTQLGLSVARRLVSLMGGECGLSREGTDGTALWFRITLAKQAEKPAPVPVIDAAPDVAEVAQGRVLIVDTDATARAATIRAAVACGFACDEAESGEEAIAALLRPTDQPYQAVFIDIDVADIEPGELAKTVASEPSFGAPALVLATNFGRPGDAIVAESWGYAAYFVKPMEPTDLREAVQEIRRRAARGPLVTRHALAERRHRARGALVWLADAEQRQTVATALRRIGHTVEEAIHAEDAVRIASTLVPDVVFADGTANASEIESVVRGISGSREESPVVICVGEAGAGWTAIDPAVVITGAIDAESVVASLESAAAFAGDSERHDTPAIAEYPPALALVESSAWGEAENAPQLATSEAAEAEAEIDEFAGLDGLPVLDTASLEASSGGREDIQRLILQGFILQWRQPLARLHEAVSAGDAEQTCHEAASLRKLCESVGAVRCSTVLSRIESEASAGLSAAVVRWAERLESEAASLGAEVEPEARAA
jgi:PAS domain S-box-containing protein